MNSILNSHKNEDYSSCHSPEAKINKIKYMEDKCKKLVDNSNVAVIFIS